MWILLLLLFLALLLVLKYLFYSSHKKHLPVNEKAVFITGCDSGIGYGLAKHLDNLGFVVFAGCLLPGDQGAKRLKKESSDRLTIIDIDVTDEIRVLQAVALVEDLLPDEEKGLWALINNAGISVCGEFDWMTWNQCQKQVDVNLLGTIRVTKNFLPMIKKSKGRIVTVTSINGKVGFPTTSIYAATKFALEGFCEALRFELSKLDIEVVVVAPGNHCNLTNVMQRFHQNLDEMWENMSAEQKEYYYNYFHSYQRSLLAIVSRNAPLTLANLMEDLLDAVIATKPKARYLCAPLGFKIIFTILLTLPYEWSNWLMKFLFRRASLSIINDEVPS